MEKSDANYTFRGNILIFGDREFDISTITSLNLTTSYGTLAIKNIYYLPLISSVILFADNFFQACFITILMTLVFYFITKNMRPYILKALTADKQQVFAITSTSRDKLFRLKTDIDHRRPDID